MNRCLAWLVASMVVSGCNHPAPRSLPDPPLPTARMAAAAALVSAGCLDCLVAAYKEYIDLRADPRVVTEASAGAIRAAALLDIRERELGLIRGSSLDAARNLTRGSAELGASYSLLLDIADNLRLGPDGPRPSTEAEVAAMFGFVNHRAQWEAELRPIAARDELAAYIWLLFACDPISSRSIDVAEARSLTGAFAETPLLTFGYLSSCERGDTDALQRLAGREPRLVELNDLLGFAALGRRPRPDIDGADERFARAFVWRSDWPSLTLSIGNIALTSEDFERAFEFFDRTLALVPDQPDALVGKIRALTYLGRYDEAVQMTDRLLATGRNLGEARYWRAFNEHQLGRLDDAWADIEITRTLLSNAQVPKLAGIVALKRGDTAVARRQLEEAGRRDGSDCETAFYLQTALATDSQWQDTFSTASRASACFDGAERDLRAEIARLQSSGGSAARVARQADRREQEVATNARMRATARFNAAVAAYNIGQADDARRFALLVDEDEQFAERARALLSRLH